MTRGNGATAEEKRAARRALAEAIVARAHLESVIGTARTSLELRDLAEAAGLRAQTLLSLGIGRGASGLSPGQLRLMADAMLRLAALPR